MLGPVHTSRPYLTDSLLPMLLQSLSALAQLPTAAAETARGPLLAAVAASASSFPPLTVTKALAALEVLAAPALLLQLDTPAVQVSAEQLDLLQRMCRPLWLQSPC